MKKLIIALFCGVVSLNAFASGDVAKGAELAKKYNCAACHGADFNKPIDPTYPKLAGQHADYLAHALVAYKRGAGKNGRNNPIMTAQVQPLSNQDMKDIGAYLSSLPGQLTVHR
ncbi:MAG TPA: cytochrome c [Telluria sp.]